MLDLVWLIPAFPLAGFLLLVAFGRRLGEPWAGYFATAMVAGSAVASWVVWAGLLDLDGEERFFVQRLFEWIPVGQLELSVGFYVDPLAMTMALFVTGIATLIHLYSVGYMHGDEHFSKFFIYMNLFVFSMLMLVLADNLVLTFLGWEGVGVCSYLLISFWFTDEHNASAGKKAFVTNRVGDWGFMMAIFLCFVTVGSVQYPELLAGLGGIAPVTATAIALLLLVGAVGKSAQLPLFVWLPDAMAGPTPVSALIHAATMVTAGVYLLVRMNPALAAAYDWAPDIIAWVGALTCFFAATAAMAQNDIKRVLAYSTISQLGYMFLAVGVGGYSAAIFHMITHAFFKALLFLGAGAVITAMHHHQDMRRYGALMKFLPVTGVTFIVGWLAIAGVPPFAGFWSKDDVLAFAWQESAILWFIGVAAAVLTAFYMAREVFMTFFTRYRFGDPTPEEIDEAWDTKVSDADAVVAEAERILAEKQAEIGAAEESVGSAQESLRKATAEAGEAETKAAQVEPARLESARSAVALAEQNDDKDARKAADRELKALEKPAKDLEKARNAVTKAETNLTKATEAVDVARTEVTEAERKVSAAAATAETVRADAEANRPSGDGLVDLWNPPVLTGVEDSLPAEVSHRREFTPHEVGWQMLTALVVLAGGAVFAGALNLPFTSDTKILEHWLEPSFLGNAAPFTVPGLTATLLSAIAVAGALVGIAVAAQMYLANRGGREVVETPFLADAWEVDNAYAAFAGGPGRRFFDLCAWFDRNVVDGAVTGIGWLVRTSGASIRTLQTGYVRNYALGLALGAVVLLGLLLSKATF